MQLPSDDSLQLTSDDDGNQVPPGALPLVIDKSSPAVGLTLQDGLTFAPSWVRKGSSALRDTWVQVWQQLVSALWMKFAFVLEAGESPRFADGIFLNASGALLGNPRVSNELDSDYRQRLLIAVDVVSPFSIKTAVSAVLSAFAPNLGSGFIYNETIVDAPYCTPATTSDPVIQNSKQQTIASLSTWDFWVQPIASSAATYTPLVDNRTVVDNLSVRLWGTDPTQPGKRYGAFSVSLAPQFYIILPSAITDDSAVPVSHNANDNTVQYGIYDFSYGISGQVTQNQTIIAVPSAAIPVPCIAFTPTSLIDQIKYEVERRRPDGVAWVYFQDLPSSQSF